jgi:hypothetical protein
MRFKDKRAGGPGVSGLEAVTIQLYLHLCCHMVSPFNPNSTAQGTSLVNLLTVIGDMVEIS